MFVFIFCKQKKTSRGIDKKVLAFHPKSKEKDSKYIRGSGDLHKTLPGLVGSLLGFSIISKEAHPKCSTSQVLSK